MVSYKAHVLSVLEGPTPAVYHASNSVLARLDRVQLNFLTGIGLSEKEAFLEYNLAPLGLRRDIAMLGLVYRCYHGVAHPDLCELLASPCSAPHQRNTRTASARHPHQIVDRTESGSLNVFRQSVFGLAEVWNLLPVHIVQQKTVEEFQRALTSLARSLCRAGNQLWHMRFSPRAPHHVFLMHEGVLPH